MTPMKKTRHLVVDTTGFIRNAQLQGISEKAYTTPLVVKEVTSKRQLRKLCVLPYELVVKEPDPAFIALVTNFSKKTGDYACVSATDIEVIALTYELESQHVGTDHLRKEVSQAPTIEAQGLPSENLKNIAGFYIPQKEKEEGEEDVENVDSDETATVESKLNNVKLSEVDSGSERDDDYDDDDEEEEDDDDDIGWITPDNIASLKAQIPSEIEEDAPEVACLTTDFAMQNILKMIGLSIVTLEGRRIKELRTFILRCYACFKTTSVMDKLFCPKCGNKTLKRVAVSTNADGTQKIHINFRKPLTARGKKFSLPTPKGGKHSNNPILCEDQPMPQQRVSKMSRAKNNPLDDDYTSGFSPFLVKDVNSRAAMLGIRPHAQIKQWMRRNPNESTKPGGRKRK